MPSTRRVEVPTARTIIKNVKPVKDRLEKLLNEVMKQHEKSPEVIAELMQFLSPNVHRNLRKHALDYVIGLSASDQFSVIFQANNYLLGRSLCRLICEDSTAENDLLPALINATAADLTCAEYIINNFELIQRCIEHCRNDNKQLSLNSAKLLSNLSLHLPEKEFSERLNDSVSCENIDYLGYVLVNLTSIANVRRLLCERFVRQILPLMDYNGRLRRCMVAIDILRNLCFENSCHPVLLDNNDEFLSTLLKPLADISDNLDDDETEKLPLQLQYYDGHRCQDLLITNKIIESLYQLCGSELGRQKLRSKGVYALLREFDRATSSATSIYSSKKNSSISPSLNENGTTFDDSQCGMNVGTGEQILQSTVSDNEKEMIVEATDKQKIKFADGARNLIYIDRQNCSTLHALIALLIED